MTHWFEPSNPDRSKFLCGEECVPGKGVYVEYITCYSCVKLALEKQLVWPENKEIALNTLKRLGYKQNFEEILK